MAKRRASIDTGPPLRENRLLAALPREDYRRLMPLLDTLPLELKRTIYKPGDSVSQVYFPNDGFFSILTVLANGDMVEVATVGHEGVVGAAAATAGTPEPSFTMVQAEMGNCHRMSTRVF